MTLENFRENLQGGLLEMGHYVSQYKELSQYYVRKT
jgi:hypothetical protein